MGGRGRAGGPHRLGAGRRLGTEHWTAAFVHCDCVAGKFLFFSTLSKSARMCGVPRSLTLARGDLTGQDRAGVDKRHADGALGQDCA